MHDTQSLDGWQLDGDSAEAYERFLVPAFFATWASELVDFADVRPGERVLDVGCATGSVARAVAARHGASVSVTGLDVNPAMLAVARRMAAEEGLEIRFDEASVLALPYGAGAFGVVCCQEALQFFPDPALALEEMRRVAGRNGRAVLTVLRGLEHNEPYSLLSDLLARHVGAQAGEGMRSPFAAGDAETLRALARKAGFDDTRVLVRLRTIRYPSAQELLWREVASSPLAPAVAALDRAQRDALTVDTVAALAPWMGDDGLVVPAETHVLLLA